MIIILGLAFDNARPKATEVILGIRLLLLLFSLLSVSRLMGPKTVYIQYNITLLPVLLFYMNIREQRRKKKEA